MHPVRRFRREAPCGDAVSRRTDPRSMPPVRGYKVFGRGLVCHGFRFTADGPSVHVGGPLALHRCGFHFFRSAARCVQYAERAHGLASGGVPSHGPAASGGSDGEPTCVFAAVEAAGAVLTDGDSYVTDFLRVTRVYRSAPECLRCASPLAKPRPAVAPRPTPRPDPCRPRFPKRRRPPRADPRRPCGHDRLSALPGLVLDRIVASCGPDGAACLAATCHALAQAVPRCASFPARAVEFLRGLTGPAPAECVLLSALDEGLWDAAEYIVGAYTCRTCGRGHDDDDRGPARCCEYDIPGDRYGEMPVADRTMATAIRHGSTSVVEWLVERGARRFDRVARVSARLGDMQLMRRAAQHGPVDWGAVAEDMARGPCHRMLEHLWPVLDDGCWIRAAACAAEGGHMSSVHACLARTQQPYAPVLYERALCGAARGGHLPLVRDLAVRASDVRALQRDPWWCDTTPPRQTTPPRDARHLMDAALDEALRAGHVALVAWFLDNGARDADRVMRAAVDRDRADLLDAAAACAWCDLDAALLRAARLGRGDIARRLVMRGARGLDGAACVALARGHRDLADWLVWAGARPPPGVTTWTRRPKQPVAMISDEPCAMMVE